VEVKIGNGQLMVGHWVDMYEWCLGTRKWPQSLQHQI